MKKEQERKAKSNKGKTQWYPRHQAPARQGVYECRVMITSNAPLFRWMLEWDGKGFVVPFAMKVFHWRGQTKAAYDAQQGGKR